MSKHQLRRNTEVGIDLLRLYSEFDTQKWNALLTRMKETRDLEKINRIIQQLNVGMANCAKQKMNSEKICMWFGRLIHSLDRTAGLIRMEIIGHDKTDPNSGQRKKAFDKEWEAYRRKTNY